MTKYEWTPYPEESLELNPDGKVTGAVKVVWQGEGFANYTA